MSMRGLETCFFPSCRVADYFSVTYRGNTHALSCLEKTLIVITAVAGLALAGIGVLLGFYVSYRLRDRRLNHCIEQDAMPLLERIRQTAPRETVQIVINGKSLEQHTGKGRYFVCIEPGSEAYAYDIPGFSSVPKGVYLVGCSTLDKAFDADVCYLNLSHQNVANMDFASTRIWLKLGSNQLTNERMIQNYKDWLNLTPKGVTMSSSSLMDLFRN